VITEAMSSTQAAALRPKPLSQTTGMSRCQTGTQQEQQHRTQAGPPALPRRARRRRHQHDPRQLRQGRHLDRQGRVQPRSCRRFCREGAVGARSGCFCVSERVRSTGRVSRCRLARLGNLLEVRSLNGRGDRAPVEDPVPP
jgi:hypothetical protein